jgi:Recombination endonuclease VII
MRTRGRPRLSLEDLEGRIAEYCRRYQAERAPSGLPSFPTGKRETRQHREWIALYKAHNRLGRRSRGQCERCSEPAADGSVFCEEHRLVNSGRAGNNGPSLEARRRLLAQQDGRCPVCATEVELSDSVDHSHEDGRSRAVLHARCSRLAGLAEAVGPEGLIRLREFLWPTGKRTRRQR